MDLRGGAHVGPGLQPEALDDRDQHRRARRAIDVEVEGVVELGGRAAPCPDRRRRRPPRRRVVSSRSAAKSSGDSFGSASATSSPSIRQRARARSSSLSRVISGTRTERLGSASSACSETSRPSASRTGMVLVCSVSARSDDAQHLRRRRTCRGSASGAVRHRRGHAASRGRPATARRAGVIRASRHCREPSARDTDIVDRIPAAAGVSKFCSCKRLRL